jgi:hypothetical protein
LCIIGGAPLMRSVSNRMFAQKNTKATGPVTFLPVLFGSIGLIVLGIYQAQRYGVLLHSFYSFDRLIQHHLDGLAGFGSLATLLGVASSFLIVWLRGQSRLVTVGTIISLMALLFSLFGLSL